MSKTLNLSEDERWTLHRLVENELQAVETGQVPDLEDDYREKLEHILDKIEA